MQVVNEILDLDAFNNHMSLCRPRRPGNCDQILYFFSDSGAGLQDWSQNRKKPLVTDCAASG